MEKVLPWDVDCSVRVDDVVEVRSIKTENGWRAKNTDRICFKFDETGVKMWCGTSLKEIKSSSMPRFFVNCAYEIQLDGIVLDYFLTSFEDSPMDENESEKEVFRFCYCKENGRSSFSYETMK